MPGVQRRRQRWNGALVLTAALALTPVAGVAQSAGEPLTEALRTLQARGLRIVFSSATVTAEMRVVRHPRSSSPRQQLDELLVPHGLRIRQGPAGILEIVRAVPATRSEPPASAATPVSPTPLTDPPAHNEFVTVSGLAAYRTDQGVAGETRVGRALIDRLYGDLADDPLRVAQSMPRATAVDEFRSEFTVRGSALRHGDVVIEGVSAEWLRHTAYGRGATGSVSMFASSVLEDATLRAGAYPRRHSDRLGPELELTVREGSRAGFALRGAVGSTTAAVLAEGPLGADEGGSWLVTGRRSLAEWPAASDEQARTAFGFADALGKVTYDLRPGQQVAMSVFGGSSSVDVEDNLAPNALADGINRALVVNGTWRTLLGASTTLRQQTSMLHHRFFNRERGGRLSDGGGNEEIAYRADLARATAHGLFEAGARVGRRTFNDVPQAADASAVSAASWQRAGYAHFAWAVLPSLTVSPGVRVTAVTHVLRPILSHWVLAEWMVAPSWSLHGSVGVSAQGPALRDATAAALDGPLQPERARHLDLAVEQRVTSTARWQATFFQRHEHDVLREPDVHPRIVGGALVEPDRRYLNALSGVGRGIELLVDRRSPAGLSGWAAYAYSRLRYTDTERHHTFWGDFDQRHALTIAGAFQLGRTARIGGAFRAGSNFPIPGYLDGGEGRLVAAGERNSVRLPAYARLDLRGDREFSLYGNRLTLYAELLNTLNRRNFGLGAGAIDRATGAATGFTEALYPRRLTAGVAVQF